MLHLPQFCWQFFLSLPKSNILFRCLQFSHYRPLPLNHCLFSPVPHPLLELLECFLADGVHFGHHRFPALQLNNNSHNAAHVHKLFLASPHPRIQLTSPRRVTLQGSLLCYREAQKACQNFIGQLHVQVTGPVRYCSRNTPNAITAAQFSQESHNESFDMDLHDVEKWFGH